MGKGGWIHALWFLVPGFGSCINMVLVTHSFFQFGGDSFLSFLTRIRSLWSSGLAT